jgi:ubiquitin C-terminal hydrolase
MTLSTTSPHTKSLGSLLNLVDVHEVLHHILSKLQTEFIVSSKNQADIWSACLSFSLYFCILLNDTCQIQDQKLTSLFHGALQHRLKCLAVDYTSTRMEPFYSLSLPIKGNKTIEDAVKHVTDELEVNDFNAVNGTFLQGFGSQKAVQTTIFAQLPPLLFLHLKRYTYDANLKREIKVRQKLVFLI